LRGWNADLTAFPIRMPCSNTAGLLLTDPSVCARLHRVKKYAATFFAAIAVLVLTVVPTLVPPDHLGWLRWKITLWTSCAVAVVALFFQIKWTKDDDDEQERRERHRDALLQRIAEAVAKSPAYPPDGPGRFAYIASELMKYVTETGPEIKDFPLSRSPQLHDLLTQAYLLQNAFYPGEFATSIPRDAIRRLAEQLLLQSLLNYPALQRT
jgi:hypothetical protein